MTVHRPIEMPRLLTATVASADISPALAQFCGIPQLVVRVHGNVSMTITTDAGDTLELPAP